MSRLRITFLTAAVLLTLVALTLNSLAQPPGRGGGFGGGFRGRGGGGGFGGRGASLLTLASNPAVQEDLKLKDKQKAQIKSLSDKYEEQSRALRAQLGGGPNGGGPGRAGQGAGQGGGRNGNGQNAEDNAIAGGAGNFGGGAGGGGGFGGGQGQDPNAQGGRGGRGNRGNRNQNGQGVPEDPAVVAQRNEQRQMASAAMNELRQGAESSLGRILDKGQVGRLKQIQLQLEGPTVVLREDVKDKLQIDEAQEELIREFRGENREAGQAVRKSQFETMRTAFARLNPDAVARGQNGGVNGNGGGGNNANDNNGQTGGGRGGRRNFNPEAFRKLMEDPQVKAQMEEIQTQQQKLDAQLASAINKVMTPRQRAVFKRMLGAPFDRSKMGIGGPWGGRGGNQATPKGTATTQAKSSDADDDDDAPKAKSTAASPAKAKPAVAKRKSLRELRGEPSSNED